MMTRTNRRRSKRDADLRRQRGRVHLLVNLGYGIELRVPQKRFRNERARCRERMPLGNIIGS